MAAILATAVGALTEAVLHLPPTLVVLVLLTGAVFALIYAYQPPIPQTAVFAFVPWIVAGALLPVLATDGRYPDYFLPLVRAPGAYLIAVFLPGLAWVAMLNLSVSRRGLPAYHHYVGAMGTGAMAILWCVLLLQSGTDILSRLAVLVVVPNVALFATGLISLSIWFWSPDFADYTPVVGGFVLFGVLVYGIATTLAIAIEGAAAHTLFSATVRDVVAVTAPGGLAGVDVSHLWVWVFLLANAAIGIHVATQLAPYADESPHAVNTMLGIVGLAGFALGIDRLLLLVVG